MASEWNLQTVMTCQFTWKSNAIDISPKLLPKTPWVCVRVLLTDPDKTLQNVIERLAVLPEGPTPSLHFRSLVRHAIPQPPPSACQLDIQKST